MPAPDPAERVAFVVTSSKPAARRAHPPFTHGCSRPRLDPDRLRDAEQDPPLKRGPCLRDACGLRGRGSRRPRRSAPRPTAPARYALQDARARRCHDRGRRSRRRRGNRALPTRTPPRPCLRAAPTTRPRARRRSDRDGCAARRPRAHSRRRSSWGTASQDPSRARQRRPPRRRRHGLELHLRRPDFGHERLAVPHLPVRDPQRHVERR